MKADFDIGNLLYVALTIVFLIIGAIGKKKKPVTRVAEDSTEPEIETDSIKEQFKDLIWEINPLSEIEREPVYNYKSEDSVEEGVILDTAPAWVTESVIDKVPANEQPIDSNINYNDQAHSSLDITGMDEGEPAFDYGRDDHSLVYNDVTREYDSTLMLHEEELVEIIDNFDPKTAFVYSEIFKRKEF